MKADGVTTKELINIKGWNIIQLINEEDEGSGISHIQCESWMQYSMRHYFLKCRICGATIPNEIVAVWLLLNSDKETSTGYFREENI